MTLTDEHISDLENSLNGITNVDEVLKKINSQKFYIDFQELWDNIPNYILTKNKNY